MKPITTFSTTEVFQIIFFIERYACTTNPAILFHIVPLHPLADEESLCKLINEMNAYPQVCHHLKMLTITARIVNLNSNQLKS